MGVCVYVTPAHGSDKFKFNYDGATGYSVEKGTATIHIYSSVPETFISPDSPSIVVGKHEIATVFNAVAVELYDVEIPHNDFVNNLVLNIQGNEDVGVALLKALRTYKQRHGNMTLGLS
jgi:hypothetical protein